MIVRIYDDTDAGGLLKDAKAKRETSNITKDIKSPRTFPDYNDYLSTWDEYKNFYDELSLSTTIRGTQTQLKNGGIVLMKLE